ncbi:hypothetical protein GKZ90_0012915 [Flavobacterium sp. MC2016-06]|uniref:hypothetical protein n=1 Tax=Flavobacterium sp. MC2016-06 TaxID=2676308 RepID=UPI0012BAFDAD|nr:hypothetical protein [Flavobacterium sp. MC2016-06]MBU3860213.1 hypothetical protein [Flavobacterium sp. MC2016-06]
MIRLYKVMHDKLHYWETWSKDETTAIVYWGIVGYLGEYKEIKSGIFTNVARTIQNQINAKLRDGYEMFDNDNLLLLEIEYKITDFETTKELHKRHRLEEKLDNLLSLTGLGHNNGGNSGEETMEVECAVIDFDMAKKAIEKELKNTEFDDYKIIYQRDNKKAFQN